MRRSFFIVVFCFYQICTSVAQKSVNGHFQYRTECLGVEQDGTQTLMAWGKGRNRFDAIDQAKKNALYDVIFNGIRDGTGGCDLRPLVPEVNARRKYEEFFDSFFIDKGAYETYVSMEDEKISQRFLRNRAKIQDEVTHGFVIRVLRPSLRTFLKEQKIIR